MLPVLCTHVLIWVEMCSFPTHSTMSFLGLSNLVCRFFDHYTYVWYVTDINYCFYAILCTIYAEIRQKEKLYILILSWKITILTITITLTFERLFWYTLILCRIMSLVWCTVRTWESCHTIIIPPLSVLRDRVCV